MEDVDIDLLNRKLNKIHEILQELISRSPAPVISSSTAIPIFKWWQIVPLLQHPLSQPIELALLYIKENIKDPHELRELLYNPCRGSLPSSKKKGQTTANSPLIPYLLHLSGFPILLEGYTDECNRTMYEEAVRTLRDMWQKQRKRNFPGMTVARTGGAGATCHEIDCQWFKEQYGGLDKVTIADIVKLIQSGNPPPLMESSSSSENN